MCTLAIIISPHPRVHNAIYVSRCGHPRFLCYNLIRSFFLFIPLAFLVSTSVALLPSWRDFLFFTGNTVGVKLTLCTSASCSYTDHVSALGSNNFVQYTLATLLYIIFLNKVRTGHSHDHNQSYQVLPDPSQCAPCTKGLISVVPMGLEAPFTDVMHPLPAHPRPL